MRDIVKHSSAGESGKQARAFKPIKTGRNQHSRRRTLRTLAAAETEPWPLALGDMPKRNVQTHANGVLGVCEELPNQTVIHIQTPF